MGTYAYCCLALCLAGKFAGIFIISTYRFGDSEAGGSYEAVMLQAETDRKAPRASSKITAIKEIPMA